MERYVNTRLILATFLFNVITAVIVFFAVSLITNNTFTAIFYTFLSWSMTVSLSVIYWIWYLYKKVKAKKRVKNGIALFLVALFVFILMIVIWTVNILKIYN